jgi:hypothetical protein
MRNVATAILIATLAATGLGACSSDSSSDSTSTDRSSVSTSKSSDGFSISTPAGEVSVSLSGDLPPGWPSDFPLPKKTDPAGSGSLGGSSSGTMVGVFSTKESGSDALDFYAGDSSLDPSSKKSAGGSSTFLGSVDLGGSYPGSVTVGEISGTTYIVAILNSDGAGSSTTTTKG